MDNQWCPPHTSSTILEMPKVLLWALHQKPYPTFHMVVPPQTKAYELHSARFPEDHYDCQSCLLAMSPSLNSSSVRLAVGQSQAL